MNRDQKIDELFSVFIQFKRHVYRQVITQTQGELSVAQAEILIAIAKGTTRLKDIAHTQNITASAAAQQLKLLQAEDLVASTESPEDRRENLLSVTLKGQELLAKQRCIMKEKVKVYFEKLSDREIDNFISCMKKMINTNSDREEVK